MTYEDVKRIRQNPTIEDVDNNELSRMIDEALEKQIPKKPNITLNNGFCGECGIAWGYARLIEEQHCGYRYFQHCPTCGQKIDWSDEG